MKVLSFDVGIKNLAYCIIEVINPKEIEHKIIEWGVIDCTDNLISNLKCCVVRKGKTCNKTAINKVIVNDKTLGFCDLKTCQKELNGTYTKKDIKKAKIMKTKDLSLDQIGTEIYRSFNNLPFLLEIDIISIENQPVLKNPTMKSIQMLIFSYFLLNKLEKNKDYEIKLFNARKKLKIYDGPKIVINVKNDYKKRKLLSIKYTEYFLNKYNNNYNDFFNANLKKDDLADSYLQGLTYIYK